MASNSFLKDCTCGEQILMARTDTGAWVPLEVEVYEGPAEEAPRDAYIFDDVDPDQVACRYDARGTGHISARLHLHVSHMLTCTDSDRHGRGRNVPVSF